MNATPRFTMIGNGVIDEEDWAAMTAKTKRNWAAYQCQDLGSERLGDMLFLSVGKEFACKGPIPPPRFPNEQKGRHYVWVGWADLRERAVIPKERRFHPPL